jgi:hypothetical protein
MLAQAQARAREREVQVTGAAQAGSHCQLKKREAILSVTPTLDACFVRDIFGID